MFIKGMDISTLLEEEACGAKYYDNGVEQDLFAYFESIWYKFCETKTLE